MSTGYTSPGAMDDPDAANARISLLEQFKAAFAAQVNVLIDAWAASVAARGALGIREVRTVRNFAIPAIPLIPGNSTVTIPWPTAFADTNYTVTATASAPSGLALNLTLQVVSQTTTGCMIKIMVGVAILTNSGATLNVIAIHD